MCLVGKSILLFMNIKGYFIKDSLSKYLADIWVVLRKGVPMCDIELVALDLHVLVADRLVQCAT